MDIELPSGRKLDARDIGIDEKGAPTMEADRDLEDVDHVRFTAWPEEDHVALSEIMIKKWSDYRDGIVRFREDNAP